MKVSAWVSRLDKSKFEEAADRGLEGGCVAFAWKAVVYNLTPAASVPVGASRPRVCLSGLPGKLEMKMQFFVVA